jgi:hypothetical protein
VGGLDLTIRPYWETLLALIAFEGGILGKTVVLVSSSVSFLHLRVIFCCETLLYRNLNQNCNILYSKHLIYCLYVCTCVFLFRQESFDMMLVNSPSFYDGGITTSTLRFHRCRLHQPTEAPSCAMVRSTLSII